MLQQWKQRNGIKDLFIRCVVSIRWEEFLIAIFSP
jgi:hypothetical protein